MEWTWIFVHISTHDTVVTQRTISRHCISSTIDSAQLLKLDFLAQYRSQVTNIITITSLFYSLEHLNNRTLSMSNFTYNITDFSSQQHTMSTRRIPRYASSLPHLPSDVLPNDVLWPVLVHARLNLTPTSFPLHLLQSSLHPSIAAPIIIVSPVAFFIPSTRRSQTYWMIHHRRIE